MNIKELAEQAGMHYRKSLDEFCEADTDGVPLEMMTRFAELVAAAEREQCAQVCEKQIKSYMNKRYTTDPLGGYRERFAAEQCAETIRQRGDK